MKIVFEIGRNIKRFTMSDNKDEKLDVSRSSWQKLVPNKFKFTSQQGRARRQKLWLVPSWVKHKLLMILL